MARVDRHYKYTLVSEALTVGTVTENTINNGVALRSGTYMKEYVIPFAKRVCKELRVRMILRDSRSYWIYRDDCPYTLGWVGYGDYRDGGDGTLMYVVQARTIVNGKYNPYSSQYFMKMSTNVGVALRNARTFIRMMSPQELAGIHLKNASDAVDRVIEVAKAEFSEIRNKVIGEVGYSSQPNKGSTLLNELRHLMNSNHEFIDASFNDNLTTFFAKQDELIRLHNRTVPMWFIRVYDRMEQQVFDVIAVDKAKYSSSGYITVSRPEISNDVSRYTADNLPEEIMQKLSVLNILQAGDYVDDVGFSAGEGMFYVMQ